MNVAISKISYDGSTQSRVAINEAVVADYAEAMTVGTVLPPVTLFFDGSDYWLADGFHRFHAHNKIGALEIDADVRNGTKRDAVLFSVGANGTHGLQRTNADKRRAVETLLADSEWSKWSDNQVSKACGVAHSFVGKIRSSLDSETSDKPSERTYTTKHGTEAVMKTSNIGKRVEPVSAETPQNPVVENRPAPKIFPTRADEVADEAFGDFDPIAELENAQQEINKLNEQIAALSTGETEAHLVKEIQVRQGIEARLHQQIDKSNQLDKCQRRLKPDPHFEVSPK